MRMSKQLSVLLAGITVLGTMLVGCGSTNTTATSGTSSTSTSKSNHSFGNGRGQHQGMGMGGMYANDQALLTLLKIDSNTLKSDMQSGKSLADIAKAQGVSEQQVIDLLVKDQEQTMDKAVSSGKMTQAQEDQRKANLPTQVKNMVEGKQQWRGKRGQANNSSSNISSSNSSSSN